MKATDLLKKQHKEVKALFKKVENTENARERRRLMNEIATALEGHTTIEEEMFYPAVRGLETQKAEEMVLEAFEGDRDLVHEAPALARALGVLDLLEQRLHFLVLLLEQISGLHLCTSRPPT